MRGDKKVAKVETILIDSSKPTQSEIEEYRHLISEMKHEIRWMDEKYGENWDNVAKSDYLRLTSLEEKLDKLQAKYPNYNFKNNQMKGNEKMENRDFEKFLQNDYQKTFECEVREVSTMADNNDVKVQNVANYVVKQLVERADLYGRCQAFSPANGVLSIPREDESNSSDDFEFVGENASLRVDKVHFNVVKAEAKRLGVAVQVTEQLILNSGIDMQSYVLDLLARKLAKALNKQMVTGNHENGSFEGLANAKAVEVKASALDSDVMLDMVHAMHPDHLDGAVFVMNRKSYNAVAKMKDLSGQYILKLERSVAPEQTRYQAFGFPILINDCVADDEVYFVNFREAYASLMPRSVRVKKIDSDSTNALNATVLLMIDAYFDAVVKNENAIVRYKQQA